MTRPLLSIPPLVLLLAAGCGTSRTPSPDSGAAPTETQLIEQVESQVRDAAPMLTISAMLSTMFVPVGTQGLRPLSDDCFKLGGDFTDNDNDGVPRRATISILCVSTEGGVKKSLSGSYVYADIHDDVPDNGARITMSLTEEFEVNDAYRRHEFSLTSTLVPTLLGYVTDTTLNVDNNGFTSEFKERQDVTLDVDKGGHTTELEGSMRETGSNASTFPLNLKYKGELHVSYGKNNCVGIDRGGISYMTTMNISTLLDFTGCNSYVVRTPRR